MSRNVRKNIVEIPILKQSSSLNNHEHSHKILWAQWEIVNQIRSISGQFIF